MARGARVSSFHTPSIFETHPQSTSQNSQIALLIKGRIHTIEEGGWVRLGSNRRSTIRVDDRHVSGDHALVRRVDDQLEILDASSTNGVWFQGKREQEIAVCPGDAFMLGNIPSLVVEMGFSEKFPQAFRWCQMVLMPGSASLLETIARWAVHDAPVVICGESGTGKERVARALHGCSARRHAPFVALNCAALPDTLAEGELFGVERGAFTGADKSRAGLFERAHGGTLFLDEIGELSPAVQAKLLRVLESGEVQPVGGGKKKTVEVRVIAATWRDLKESSTFRHDLYQRLYVLPIHLKSLRHRSEEIGPLLEMFLRERRALRYWPDEERFLKIVSGYWPGNIRELRSRAIRCACTGESTDLVPTGIHPIESPVPRWGKSEPAQTILHIRRCLKAHKGNRSAAAKELGISRSTLYRWLDRSG
jgi:transcriptional regulator of acetoin/glycerol metabolism